MTHEFSHLQSKSLQKPRHLLWRADFAVITDGWLYCSVVQQCVQSACHLLNARIPSTFSTQYCTMSNPKHSSYLYNIIITLHYSEIFIYQTWL